MEKTLLQRIEAFLTESRMPPSVLGRDAVHDPRLISDLRGGRAVGRSVECRVEHFMNKWRADRCAGHVAPRGDRSTRAMRRPGAGARRK